MPSEPIESAAILARRTECLIRLDQLKKELGRLNQMHDGRIAALQREADALARDFRALLTASQEAYRQGDKKQAKKLSSQGRAIERGCKKRNAEANGLREHFKQLHREIAATKSEIDRLNDELKKCSSPQA